MFLNRAQPAGEEEGGEGILGLSWCGIIKNIVGLAPRFPAQSSQNPWNSRSDGDILFRPTP